jgi:hypothetical protein
MSDMMAELRRWANRHCGQQLMGQTRNSRTGAEADLTGLLTTNADGYTVVRTATGEVLLPDIDVEYANLRVTASGGKAASVFAGGQVVSASGSRSSSPAEVPAAFHQPSPAPVNPHAAPAAASIGPQNGLDSLAAAIQALASAQVQMQNQQQQQLAALTTIANSLSRTASLSPAPSHVLSSASTSGSADTAAVLSHLKRLEDEKSKVWSSFAIPTSDLPIFSTAEVAVLAALPLPFLLHKEEPGFHDTVAAIQHLAAFIVHHLQPAFASWSPVGSAINAFFTSNLKSNKATFSIERAARLRSACDSLDLAITARSNTLAQHAFLDIAMLALLLDATVAASYPRLTLATVSAPPASKTAAEQGLSGKSLVRPSKNLSGLPIRKGEPGF